jgi:hypothetical protein
VVREEVELLGGFHPDADAVQPKVLSQGGDRERDRPILGNRGEIVPMSLDETNGLSMARHLPFIATHG